LVRTIATTRIMLPTAIIRLSAGRLEMSDECQTLCFAAGANAIFTGDVLLTTPNPGAGRDAALMEKLGLTPLAANHGHEGHAHEIYHEPALA
jgi:biotin synthase